MPLMKLKNALALQLTRLYSQDRYIPFKTVALSTSTDFWFMQDFGESTAKTSVRLLFAQPFQLNIIGDHLRFPSYSLKSCMSQTFDPFRHVAHDPPIVLFFIKM